MTEPHWLTLARDLIGLREIKGPQHEPEILALARDAKLSWYRDDETAWCAVFVCGVLERTGINATRSAAARSFEHWGIDVLDNGVEKVPLGAIVVYSRPPNPAHGHVGFAVGRDQQGRILTIGGNQKDSVNISPFDPGRLIAARWPAEYADDLGIIRYLPVAQSADVSSTQEA